MLVSVYVERPRRELKTNPSRKRHQHHVRGRVITGGKVGGGYDRRAHLLHYSQQLREAARVQSPSSTPSNQSPLDSPNNPQHVTIVPQVLFHFIYLHHMILSYLLLIIIIIIILFFTPSKGELRFPFRRGQPSENCPH